MPTPMHMLDRHLTTMEAELAKGSKADVSAIEQASSKFHNIMPRISWGGGNLKIKQQFMNRWFDLNNQAKDLATKPAQRRAFKEEQLSLAI